MYEIINRGDVQHVRIDSLHIAGSPRSGGLSDQHVRLLAESSAGLPPILVHRRTRRVVDGAHRILAATMRGEDVIAAEFIDGCDDELFVAAVRANVVHGLPLSAADRENAAVRIMLAFPQWSDRAVAATAGLAPGTVGAIRRRELPAGDAVTARVGRDGKVRPLNSADGRRVASAVIRSRPDASLREVSKIAGVSPATVRDVKFRLQRGDDPVPSGQRRPSGPKPRPRSQGIGGAAADTGSSPDGDVVAILDGLRNDPSLRFTESGRELLRWLATRARGPEGWQDLIHTMPPHCAYLVASIARRCAEEWTGFAEKLERQAQESA